MLQVSGLVTVCFNTARNVVFSAKLVLHSGRGRFPDCALATNLQLSNLKALTPKLPSRIESFKSYLETCPTSSRCASMVERAGG